MNITDSPKKQAVPFGVNGQREDILATTPAGENNASYDSGFPAITMTLKAAGGLPPKGQNMNQILYELANVSRWSGAGGGYVFDSAFATAVGGYPLGSRVLSTDGAGYWMNTTNGNSSNPEVTTGALTGWVPIGFTGTSSITGLASSNVTLTSLQAARERIILTGTLTANINLVVPAWVKGWTVVNNCSGSFSVTVKTPSGTGIAVATGAKANLWGDGTNITDNSATDVIPITRGGTGSTTAAAARTALGLGTAAQRDVGTGTNQIPDMNSFTSSLGTTGWEKLPSGKIRQWGKVAAATGDTRYPVTFPIPFPSSIYSVQVSFGYTGAFVNIAVFAEATNPTTIGFDANRQDAGSVFSVPTGFIFWEAIGS